MTYGWGRRALNPRAAFFGAMMLALSPRFVYFGRMLTMNGLLCLWTVTALAAAHFAVQGRTLRWRWWLASAVCCGLGLLTKGPVALALTAVPVLAFQWLDPRVARPNVKSWAAYGAVALGLAAPWFAAMALSDSSFSGYFFWKHHVLRYLAPFDHEEPFWFYLPGLLLGMMPWTLLLPWLVVFLARRAWTTAQQRPAALGFCLLAAGWSVVFYSLAGCKRSCYILPAMPPLALALGAFLDALLSSQTFAVPAVIPERALARLAYRSTLLVLSIAAIAGLSASAAGILDFGTAGMLAGCAALGCTAVVLKGKEWQPARAWLGCGVATFTVLFVGIHQILPGYARRFSLRDQVQPLAELAREDGVQVACYPRRWDSVSFYLRRSDVQVYAADRREAFLADLEKQPTTLVFIKSANAAAELLDSLPANLEYSPKGRRDNIVVGLVRQRRDALPYLIASAGR